MNFGNETPNPRPEEQADGFSGLDETVVGTLADDSVELAEEIADRATIDELFDSYIASVQEMFNDAIEVSLEGNAVKTHLELANFGEDVIQSAFDLRADLIAKLAERGEAFEETGINLRKQVVDEQEEQEEEN